ncbi:MAG TPA: hypothetical protein VFX51_24395, partial [Solirubrobacteraceae bacterium]|nr:hypothetical protein [Solirubrobacteraceae bacterium]
MTVTYDVDSGILTLVDNASADDVLSIEQTAGQSPVQLISDTEGLTNNTNGACTVPVGGGLSCALVTSIAIDLGGGIDNLLTSPSVTVPISAAGGSGGDSMFGGSNRDTLAGGPGNDALNGRGGIDSYFGETGDDTIEARDGLPERIACGAGTDLARNDFTDIIAECERGVDA